jgi:hypothetical protein
MYHTSVILRPENFPDSITMGGLLFKKALSARMRGVDLKKFEVPQFKGEIFRT